MEKYNDFILRIEGSWDDGFSIRTSQKYYERGNIVKREGQDLPFDATPFFQDERPIKIFNEIQLAIHRQPYDPQLLYDFGAELFKGLFHGTIEADFDFARTLARATDRGLRIRLHLPSPLQALPWELMLMREEPADFLCLNADLSLIRLGPDDQTDVLTTIEFPLRILVVVSTPFDRQPLNARKEMKRLLRSLKDLIRAGKAEVDFIHGPDTVAHLRQRLRAQYHILHYIGHSSDVEGPVSLVLEDPERNARKLNATALQQRLSGARLPSLVFLNACKGGSTSVISPQTSIAEGFLNIGVTAVIAHQFEISDDAAVVFARSIYDSLVEGTPLEDSINTARYALNEAYSLEWVTPVFFTRNTSEPVFLRQQQVNQALAPRLSYLIDQAIDAARNQRWSEVADYAYTALLIQDNQPDLRKLQEDALQHEDLDNNVHHATFHKTHKDWDEVVNGCDRYLNSAVAPSRSDRGRVVKMKFETYVRRARKAERNGNWGEAVNWYEKHLTDPYVRELPKSEQDRVRLLMRVAQLGTGVCDPYLRWKG